MHHPHEPGAALLDPLSQIPLKNDPWPIFLKLTGDLPQMVGKCAVKMGSGCHQPPLRRAAWSKCAKSHPELPVYCDIVTLL